MTDYTPADDGRHGLGHAVRTMPMWKITLLGLSLLLGVVGLAGQFVASNLRHTTPVAQAAPTHAAPGNPATPAGSSGFVGGNGPATADQTTPTPAPGTPAPQGTTLTDKVTPYMTGLGFSFFVGLVVGFVFRTFLRLAAVITVVVVTLAMGLSYFHVINVDLSSVKTQAGQATSWLTEQAGHLKDLIFAHLPSAGGAATGFLFGMKKR